MLNAKNKHLKSFIFTFFLGIFLSFHFSMNGGGYETPGLGVRANKMGGAFTAVADDWTAIFWNPAGLTQLKGSGAGGYFEYIQGSFKDRNGIKNFTATDFSFAQRDTFQKIYSSEPSTLPTKRSTTSGVNPSNGGHFELSENTMLGFGSYVPLGNAAKFNGFVLDNTTGGAINYTYSNFFFLLVNNLSLAHKFSDFFAIGVGLDFVVGELALEAIKNYSGGANVADYSFVLDQKAQGTGINGTLGLMFFPSDKIRLGFNYRTGTTLELSGQAHFSNSALAVNEESDFKTDLLLPTTYNFGIAWQIEPYWLFSASWQMTDWRKQKAKVSYETPGTFLNHINVRSGWRRSHRYRIGSDFTINNQWSFQMGYGFDQSAIPKHKLSLTGLVDVSQHVLTLGPTLKNDSWVYDLGYQYAYGSLRLGPGNRFEQVISSLFFGGTYNF